MDVVVRLAGAALAVLFIAGVGSFVIVLNVWLWRHL